MPEAYKPPLYLVIQATTDPTPVIPERARGYKYFKLQPRLTNADGTPNVAGNLLFGDALVQSFELTPGTILAEWWPVDHPDDLYVRTVAGSCSVAVVFSDRRS